MFDDRKIVVEKSFTMELLEELKHRSNRWKIACFISLAMWGGTIVVFYAKLKCKLLQDIR